MSTQWQQASKDVAFVRAAVEKLRPRPLASIYYLWAGIVLIGFLMQDLAPYWTARYWTIAAPSGFLVSCVFGYLAYERNGIRDKTGWRIAAHWAGATAVLLFVAQFFPALAAAGVAPLPILLAVLALAYWSAGMGLEPALAPVGALCMVGAVVAQLSHTSIPWSVFGAAMAAGLFLCGHLNRPSALRTNATDTPES